MQHTPTDYERLIGNTDTTSGILPGQIVDLERREAEQSALNIDTVALTAAIRAERILQNVGYRD